MIGEPVAICGAFLDFGAAVVERLAHLLGHQPDELRLALAQDRSGLAHHGRALGEGGAAPIAERPMRRRGGGKRLVDRMRLV